MIGERKDRKKGGRMKGGDDKAKEQGVLRHRVPLSYESKRSVL